MIDGGYGGWPRLLHNDQTNINTHQYLQDYMPQATAIDV